MILEWDEVVEYIEEPSRAWLDDYIIPTSGTGAGNIQRQISTDMIMEENGIWR